MTKKEKKDKREEDRRKKVKKIMTKWKKQIQKEKKTDILILNDLKKKSRQRN